MTIVKHCPRNKTLNNNLYHICKLPSAIVYAYVYIDPFCSCLIRLLWNHLYMRQWIKLIYKNLSNARFVINYLYFEHWNWNFIFYIYPYRMRISHILVHIQRSLQIFSSVNKKNYCKIVITSTSASLAYIWLHMSSCSQMSCNQPIPMCQDMSQLSKHGCEWK